jgi:hypothetical protein
MTPLKEQITLLRRYLTIIVKNLLRSGKLAMRNICIGKTSRVNGFCTREHRE